MDAKKREIRNLECQLSFREAPQEASEKGILGTICGRAICFNAESQVIDEDGQIFREVIAPEAATMDFLNTQDIKINMLHMRELTFGRAKRGVSGNARLSVDNEGVNFEVDVPNCDLGIRARELTKAGVYDGCSFEFYPDKFDVEEREHRDHLYGTRSSVTSPHSRWEWTPPTCRPHSTLVSCTTRHLAASLRRKPKRKPASEKSRKRKQPSSVR